MYANIHYRHSTPTALLWQKAKSQQLPVLLFDSVWWKYDASAQSLSVSHTTSIKWEKMYLNKIHQQFVHI